MEINSNQIEAYFDKLWPICRSITGNGLRESLKILQEIIPLKLHEVATGTKVLDWAIPKEWNINEAYIITPSGEKICDYKINNLHVVNYSIPVNKSISFEELKPHLYFKEELSEAIPYVTSYYKENWGFCISFNQYKKLSKEGKYHVFIDSKLEPGSLTYGDLVLPGKSKKEVLFTSYLCHPSMANNELSGPLTLAFLYTLIAKIKNRKYTYRFVLAPETIGAIAYLEKHGDTLKENVFAGCILTCCGDKGKISYKKSSAAYSLGDEIICNSLQKKYGIPTIYEFDPIGSDERQYGSPGYRLPIGTFMRTKFHDFKEYHTSLDNKSFFSIKSIKENIDFLADWIKKIENFRFFKRTNPFGEPNMGKRNLYQDLANKQNMPEKLTLRMRLLNFSDGIYPISTFIKRYNYSEIMVEKEIQLLTENNLIKEV